MADVELAQHLAEQLCEVVAVTDPRQVLGVDVLEADPVGPVIPRRVERLERAAPDVLELGLALGLQVDGHLAPHPDRIALAAPRIDLGQRAVGQQEDRLLLLVPGHPPAVGVEGRQHLGLARPEVGRPEVHPPLEACEVEESVAVLIDEGVAER